MDILSQSSYVDHGVNSVAIIVMVGVKDEPDPLRLAVAGGPGIVIFHQRLYDWGVVVAGKSSIVIETDCE
jgi:hypothetical protein